MPAQFRRRVGRLSTGGTSVRVWPQGNAAFPIFRIKPAQPMQMRPATASSLKSCLPEFFCSRQIFSANKLTFFKEEEEEETPSPGSWNSAIQVGRAFRKTPVAPHIWMNSEKSSAAQKSFQGRNPVVQCCSRPPNNCTLWNPKTASALAAATSGSLGYATRTW